MVEEILVTDYLSSQMIAAGAELIRHLQAEEFDVEAAFWSYKPDHRSWRLMISSPLVQQEGSRNAYQKIHTVTTKIEKQPHIRLQNISVLSSHDPLVRALIKNYEQAAVSPGIHLPRQVIDDQFTEDVFLYKLDA